MSAAASEACFTMPTAKPYMLRSKTIHPDLPCPALTVCRPRPQNMLRNIGDQDSVPAIQNAIGQAYVATNKEICMRMASSSEAGSCAVTFLVTRAAGALHLFIANAGDCRAVLCTGEMPCPLGGCVPIRRLYELVGSCEPAERA